jgi:hypothetical protein
VVQRDLLLTVSASLSGTLLKLRQRDVSTTRRKDIRIREKHPWKPSVGLGIDGVSLDELLKLFYLLTVMLSNISNHHKCFQGFAEASPTSRAADKLVAKPGVTAPQDDVRNAQAMTFEFIGNLTRPTITLEPHFGRTCNDEKHLVQP